MFWWKASFLVATLHVILTEYTVTATIGLPPLFSNYSAHCQTLDFPSEGEKRYKVIHHYKHHLKAAYNDTAPTQRADGVTVDSDSGVYDQMLRIDAMDLAFDSASRKTSSSFELGQCTLPHGNSHVYSGEDHFTPYATTVPTFIKRTSSSSTSEFRDIMGGASVNVLGLFGASAKVQVTESTKRSGKTMLIISKYKTQKGFVSRLNAKPNVQNQNDYCQHAGRHYHVSDLMLGAEDYTYVELEFEDEQKRKETEVNIKIKILFFSISKTIKSVTSSSKQKLKIQVIRVSSYPFKHKVICDLSKPGGQKTVVELLEAIERQRDEMQNAIKTGTVADAKFHTEYFLTPCPVWDKSAEEQNDPLATELDLSRILQQQTELRNVIAIAETEKENSDRRDSIQELLTEVKGKLSSYQKLRASFGQKPITQSMADQMLDLYGKDFAPYHYKLKLNSLLDQTCAR